MLMTSHPLVGNELLGWAFNHVIPLPALLSDATPRSLLSCVFSRACSSARLGSLGQDTRLSLELLTQHCRARCVSNTGCCQTQICSKQIHSSSTITAQIHFWPVQLRLYFWVINPASDPLSLRHFSRLLAVFDCHLAVGEWFLFFLCAGGTRVLSFYEQNDGVANVLLERRPQQS